MKKYWFAVLMSIFLIAFIVVDLIIFFPSFSKNFSKSNQKPVETPTSSPVKSRSLKFTPLPAGVVFENKPVTQSGDFRIIPANPDKEIEERLVVSGIVVKKPSWDKEKKQTTAILSFKAKTKEVTAQVLFSSPEKTMGICWAPAGVVEDNLKWESINIKDVTNNLQTGDQLIIHVPLDQAAQKIISLLQGTNEGELNNLIIGPVIQMIAPK